MGDRRLEGGGEQLAGGQAAVGSPFLGDGEDLLLGGKVVEPIHGLDGLAESEVARQDDALSLQRDDEGACTVQGPMPGMAVSSAISSSSGSLLKASWFSRSSGSRSARPDRRRSHRRAARPPRPADRRRRHGLLAVHVR